MAITQFGAYKVKEHLTFQSQEVQTYLRLLSSKQEPASGHPLMIYTDDRDPALFYLLSGWDSAEAQMEWALKDVNTAFLTRGLELATVELTVSIGLDISDIPDATGALSYTKINGSPLEVRSAPGQLWVGHGPDLQNPGAIYQFAAFDALKRVDAIPSEYAIMDRVRL